MGLKPLPPIDVLRMRNEAQRKVIAYACHDLGLPETAKKIAGGKSDAVPFAVAMRAVGLALDAKRITGTAANEIEIEIVTERAEASIAAEEEASRSRDRPWCAQCDRCVSRKEADLCRSKWCGARP